MEDNIVWQDPPTARTRRGINYDTVIESLKANPGRWALVIQDWRTSSGPAAFRQKGCDMTTRRNKDPEGADKTWSVFVRYPVKVVPPSPSKVRVENAIATGTALKPPAPAVPRQSRPPANDMGLSSFLAERRARGAVDVRE